MHTIGLIGGMSWESTALYYRLLNEGIKARCGGLHSAHHIALRSDLAARAHAAPLGRHVAGRVAVGG